MKSYVINLDRSPERLVAFTTQAQKAGITFERFSAIDGKLVAPEIIRAQVADKFEFQPINLYEAALFLSHRALWQKLLDSGDACCAIFEDDVVLSTHTVKALALIDDGAIKFDVVKLETTNRKILLERTTLSSSAIFSLKVLKSWHGGTAGYAISRHGAQTLLALTPKVADPVDQALFNPLSKLNRKIIVLQLQPAVAIQFDILHRGQVSGGIGSTIERKAEGRFALRHSVSVDLSRLLKKFQAKLRFYFLRFTMNMQSTNVNFLDT